MLEVIVITVFDVLSFMLSIILAVEQRIKDSHSSLQHKVGPSVEIEVLICAIIIFFSVVGAVICWSTAEFPCAISGAIINNKKKGALVLVLLGCQVVCLPV